MSCLNKKEIIQLRVFLNYITYLKLRSYTGPEDSAANWTEALPSENS